MWKKLLIVLMVSLSVGGSAWGSEAHPVLALGSPAPNFELPGVDGQQLIGAEQSHGDQRDTGTNSHVGWATHERAELTVVGAATFRKDEEWHAGLEGTDAVGQAGDGRARIIDGDRDLTGAVEVPADERQLPKIASRQNAELERQRAEDGGRIHIGEVIGGVDRDRMMVEHV